MKHFTFLVFLSAILMLNGNVQGKPQDIADAAVLAFAQVKDSFDNGAAASDKKEFEFLGAKVKNDMQMGFGDAARSKRSNRLPVSEISSQLSQNLNVQRDKRAANVSNFAREMVQSKEMLRTKRETDENSLELGNSSEEYDYSSSSSSESESQENERRKRSAAYEKFVNIFHN